MNKMDANEIISFISNSKKSTPVKVYIKGELEGIDFGQASKTFITGNTGVVFGEWSEVEVAIETAGTKIEDYVVENDRRNSAIPLLDLKGIKARIEPGAIIRDQVSIGDNAVIMMGASINIGSVIGEGTMIDMNAILGGRATVGKNCHVGAGACDPVVDVVDTQHLRATAGTAAADARLEHDLVPRARDGHLRVEIERQPRAIERPRDRAPRARVTVIDDDREVLAGSHTAPSIGLRRPLLDQIEPENVSQVFGIL